MTPGGRTRARGVAPKGSNSFCTNIVMLHMKSKVDSGAKILPRGHVTGSLEVKK